MKKRGIDNMKMTAFKRDYLKEQKSSRGNSGSASEDGGDHGASALGDRGGAAGGGGGRGRRSSTLDGKVARVLGGIQHDSEGELGDGAKVAWGSPVGVAIGLGAINGGDIDQEGSVVAVCGVDQLDNSLGGVDGGHVRGRDAGRGPGEGGVLASDEGSAVTNGGGEVGVVGDSDSLGRDGGNGGHSGDGEGLDEHVGDECGGGGEWRDEGER